MLQHHLDGPLPQLLRMFPVWSWPLPLTSQSLQESLGRFSGTSLGPLTAANRCLRLPPVVQGRLHHRKILSASRGVRVVGAKARLADPQGTLMPDACASQVALFAQNKGEIVEAISCFRVISTKASLADCKGTLMQRAGAVRVALAGQDGGEVVEALGGVGVVGTKAGRTDCEGTLGHGAGVVEVGPVS